MSPSLKIDPTLKKHQQHIEHLFTQGLLQWDRLENSRSMPWKGEKDAYKIWLSEVILQQTRVEQGLKYYEKFIAAFPEISLLAAAPPEKIFKLWEGLGYYSRCRNLITTAQLIAGQLGGHFPRDYPSILRLKGIGSYTAAAISSFAFNLPYAVVDGNVFRVLSRAFNINLPIDSSEGKKFFAQLAQEMLPTGQPAVYNQAIMDFGATICKPVPVCKNCFFNEHCQAYLIGKQDLLPFKAKRIKVRERRLNYFVISSKDFVLIHQRNEVDIWRHLYEFPLIETIRPLTKKNKKNIFTQQFGFMEFEEIHVQHTRQKLTHQLIYFSISLIKVSKRKKVAGYKWIKMNELDQYAFPRTLQNFIRNHLLDQHQVAGR